MHRPPVSPAPAAQRRPRTGGEGRAHSRPEDRRRKDNKDRWFTPDFDAAGTVLLVILHIATPDEAPDRRTGPGSVAADETLTEVFGPTSTLAGVHFPGETLDPGDLLPFIDLGGFAPEEAEPFDLVFTCHWGESGPVDALRTAFAAFPLAPL